MTLRSSRLRLTQAIYFGSPQNVGGGTVTSVSGGNGITATPSPIVGIGNVALGPLSSDWNAGDFNIHSKNSTDWINVAAAATGGIGTVGNPWTGWDAAIVWTAGTTYYARAGFYSYAVSPNFGLSGLTLLGDKPGGDGYYGTVFVCTGAGNLFIVDGTPTAATNCKGTKISDITVYGTGASAANGFFLKHVVNGCFENLRCAGSAGSGFYCDGVQQSRFVKPVVSGAAQWGAFLGQTPVNGLSMTAATLACTTNVVEGIEVENVSGDAVILSGSPTFGNLFIGGVAEDCGGRAINIQGGAERNTVINFDSEVNTGTDDYLIAGDLNTFINCTGTSVGTTNSFHLTFGGGVGRWNTVYGGLANKPILIDAGVLDSAIVGKIRFFNGITDNGTGTTIDAWDNTNAIPQQVLAGRYDQNSNSDFVQSNRAIGATAMARFFASADSGGCTFEAYSSGWVGTGIRQFSAASVQTSLGNGMGIGAVGGGGVIRFYAGGSASTDEKARVTPTGVAVGTTTAATRELDLSGTQRWRGIAAPAVSEANSGTIYFDSGLNKYRVSMNGGAYVDLVGSGGVTGAGVAGKLAYWTAATNLTDEPNITLGGAYTLDLNGDLNFSAGKVVRWGGTEAIQIEPTAGSTTIGLSAMGIGFPGVNNTAVGNESISGPLGAADNAAVGYHSLHNTVVGNQNAALGSTAGQNNDGSDNVFVGYLAGTGNTTGSQNVLLGSAADVTAINLTNAIAIGYQAQVAASNSMVLGNGVMNVGIRTSTPTLPLDVNGAFGIRHHDIALVNGLNSDVVPTLTSFLRITGPSAPFSVGGFTSGVDGRILMLYNTVAFQMTIVNEDGASVATNRITTLTGGNVVLRAGTSACTLVYEDAADRWILMSTN